MQAGVRAANALSCSVIGCVLHQTTFYDQFPVLHFIALDFCYILWHFAAVVIVLQEDADDGVLQKKAGLQSADMMQSIISELHPKVVPLVLTQLYKYTIIQLHKYTLIQIHKYKSTISKLHPRVVPVRHNCAANSM